MTFGDAATFRQALERRLDERTGGDPVRLLHSRTHVACERLLARLLAVAPGQWALTGELALDLRLRGRPMDDRKLDIEWRVDRFSELSEVPVETAEHDAGDFFRFEVEKSGEMVSGRRIGRSFQFHAFIAEEAFETVWVEFTLRYGQLPTEPLSIGDVLEFAGIDPVEVEAVLLEIQVAEMLRSYCGACASGFDPSHATDLLDLSQIAEQASLDAAILREVLDAIFARHNDDLPTGLPSPFAEWAEPFRRIAESAEAPAELDAAAALLDPVLSGEVTEGAWNAAERRWSDPSGNGHPPLQPGPP
jgi:Nucleotidyl transferase AbiEii toxin, Type IV TA system